MKAKIIAGATLIAAASAVAQANTIFDDVITELRDDGMIVQHSNSLTSFKDCLNNNSPDCRNFSNTSVIYSGSLFPCPVSGCTKASPGIALPTPEGLVEFPASLAWSIDINEAMVMYGILPPGVTHFGYQAMIYERSESEVPNPGGRTPLLEGENPPAVVRLDNGVIVDATVGETLNELTIKSTRIPGSHNKNKTFVLIATPNQLLADEIKESFMEVGYPRRGINIKALPARRFTFGNDPKKADTFRIVGRYARPFEDENAFHEWTQSNPMKLMRITAIKETGYIPFVIEKELDRLTGTHEIEAVGQKNYIKWLNSTRKAYGKPNYKAEIIPREYRAEHCIETGSYCWGNNLDALYIDINDPYTGKMLVVDLNSPNSQLVISGIDHVTTNYAKFWNFGFYHPDTGEAIATIDFDKVQLQEYNNRIYNSERPITYIERSPDKNFFQMAVKSDCDGIKNCFEIDTSRSNGKFKIMMRTYVNPQTGTGPDYSEVVNPEFWVYKN